MIRPDRFDPEGVAAGVHTCHLINRHPPHGGQAKTFEQEGGFSERLYRERSEARVRDGGK